MRIRICVSQCQQTHSILDRDTDHSNEEPWLLCGTPDTGVTDDSNSETSSETRETDRETSTKLDEALEEGHFRGNCRQRVSACTKPLG